MITSHHSFSTRIFLNETPAAHASVVTPAAEQADNLREFWWFLRNAPQQSREVVTAQRQSRMNVISHVDSGVGAKHA